MFVSKVVEKIKYFYRKIFFSFYYSPDFKCQEVDFDILIPVVSKDLKVLPYTINSLKTIYKKNIFIVAPNNEEIKNFCNINGVTYLNEDEVLDIKKDDLDIPRKGWIFQQILKLGVNKYLDNKNILVWDADTIVLNKVCFFDNKKRQIFYISDEYHKPYFEVIKDLFDTQKVPNYSNIVHFMMFNKEVLEQFQAFLEKKYQKKWEDVIIDLVKKHGTFSEFEVYSYFYKFVLKKPFLSKYWSNKMLSYDYLNKIPDKYKNKQTISFHSWYKKG